jgi:hypothetical protein
MKRFLFLCGLFSVSLVALLAFNNQMREKSFKHEGGEEEERGIKDAMQWWYNVRSNQETGLFDIGAIRWRGKKQMK